MKGNRPLTERAEQFIARRVDGDNRVCVDAPCINCGYNLRSLEADAVCTECAHPVQLSIGGELLRFASPTWVRGMAKGLLIIVIALAAMIGGSMLISMIAMAVMFTNLQSLAAGPPVGAVIVMNVVQTVFQGFVVLAVAYGLFKLSAREPATAGKTEGLGARRILRVGAAMMPIPIVVGIILLPMTAKMSAVSMTPTTMPTSAALAPLALLSSPLFLTLMGVNVVVSVFAYGVTPLATFRLFGGLMRRIPRPGLVRFAKVEFWGVLGSGILLLLMYGWLFVSIIIPMLSWLSTTGPALASAPFVASGPAGGAGAVTTMPTTSPAGVPPPPIRGGRMSMFVSIGGSACGGLAVMGFGIAGLVLLIMVQRALSGAAKEGESMAAALVATSPPEERA